MEDIWARIVEKASLIPERLAGGFVPDDAQPNDVLVAARLDKWGQTVAKGDWKKFARRLAHDDLDLSATRRVLGAVRLDEDQTLPAWSYTLREVIQDAEALPLKHLEQSVESPTCWGRTIARDRCLDPADPIPFEDVLLPFIHVARQRLIAQPDTHYRLLPEACQAALERDLLRALSYIGARTLLLAFSVFRTLEQREILQVSPENPSLARKTLEFNDHSRKYYIAFVKELVRGGLRALFQEYSVLARLLATQTDFWAEAVGEFLRRLQADWPEIQQIGQSASQVGQAGDFSLGQIVAIEAGLSDPHHDGRSVIAIEFASGLKLVYKPKDVGIEKAYHTLIEWLNAQRLSPPLKPLKVINRTTHGWVEFVEHRPCQNREEARQYYQRAGILLALLYALQGTDYHCENLIACGAHPVPVDHEMLMQPSPPEMKSSHGVSNLLGAVGDAVQLAAYQQLNRSVLSTGLLPTWEVGADGQAYDISALGVTSRPSWQLFQLKWKHINTDRMARVWEPVTVETSQLSTVPTLDGVALSLNDYHQDLLAGFRRMYRFLLDHREALLAPDGPLAAFKGQTTRFTFRKTSLYRAVLHTTLAPRYMRDGADRSIQLDLLSRALLSSRAQPLPWLLLRAEQVALAQMDIPRFRLRTDNCALILDDGEIIENCLPESGYQLAISHFASLSEADLERQIGFIQALLVDWGAREAHRTTVENLEGLSLPDPEAIMTLTQEQMIKQAVEIAETLQKHAIRSADGATWIHLECNPRIGRYQLEPLDYDLYSGSCGVALFLAALGKITAEAQYRRSALAALQPVRQALQALSKTQALTNIGGASGLGSVIYALVQISQFLNKPALLEDAQCAASLLTLERIAEDQALDVVLGAAGAILGLLALYDACATPPILARAVACGQHLLKARVASNGIDRAWPTLDGKLLTGFSHGAAGIAYALLRLYEATGEAPFQEAAREAIAYERSVFNPEAGNWPDFRASAAEGPSFMTSWCHGAPGIGLARLGALRVSDSSGIPNELRLDTGAIRADIDVALETTQRYGAQGPDHLCCGTLGRAELLLTASSQLSRPDLLEIARGWASWVVNRAKRVGGYTLRLSPQLDHAYSPGFFQGTAGVGYQLLRLAYPSQLPSVLLWE